MRQAEATQASEIVPQASGPKKQRPGPALRTIGKPEGELSGEWTTIQDLHTAPMLGITQKQTERSLHVFICCMQRLLNFGSGSSGQHQHGCEENQAHLLVVQLERKKEGALLIFTCCWMTHFSVKESICILLNVFQPQVKYYWAECKFLCV